MRTSFARTGFLSGFLILAACTSSSGNGDGGGGTDATTVAETSVPTDGASADVVVTGDAVSTETGNTPDAAVAMDPESCDPLVPSVCALPWPSDMFLKPDATRRTGYTLTFGPNSLPHPDRHNPTDPTAWKRLDGYGLGVPVMVLFPNLDVSGIPDENAIQNSIAADAQVMLFQVTGTTLTRVPYFAELDSREPDLSKKILFVRPAVILEEGTKYIVAFRNLHTTSHDAIAPSDAFVKLRDGHTAGDPALAARQARFDEMFTLLQGAGVTKESLTLAWSFNTASGEALHGRLVSMRDQALALYPHGADLHLTHFQHYARTAADLNADAGVTEVNADVAMEITGTFTVPHFMKVRRLGTDVGWEFNTDASGNVVPNGTREAPVWIRVPWSAMDGTPHGVSLFGHGLLGEGDQVGGHHNDQTANANHIIWAAADMTGMATDDVAGVLSAINNPSNFVSIADRLHQGMIEWVLLARAMRDRFDSVPAIAALDIHVNTSELFYSGISQGGIFGGTFMALTPDIRYGHLGSCGNNYSTLLERSTDFSQYFAVINPAYHSRASQTLLIATFQLLWDGTDPVSYLRHLSTDPITPGFPHQVLMAIAKGDHQVSPLTDENTARTTDIGIPLLPNYDSQRMPWNAQVTTYPHHGSGIVLFDLGNPWAPPGNRVTDDTRPDPHDRIHEHPERTDQMVHFWRTGDIIDTCGGDGCVLQPN